MNSVGIDVSKGRSTVAAMRPFGEVVISPFEVCHTDSELSELARRLKSLDGETRVVMESTGNYHLGVRTFFWTYLRYFLNFSASISMEKVGPKMSSSTIPIADVESISSPEFVSKTWISISSSFGYARSRVIKSPTFILLFLRIHYLAQAQAAPVFQRTHPIEGLFDAVLIVPMKVRI